MATSTIQAGNLFSVNGLVAVITGGGSGIGLMMARALALNGAHKVYIIGRRSHVLEEAATSVTTGNIIPMTGDVTSKEDLSRIVKSIEEDCGYVNVLIANSGILGPQSQASITPTTSIEEFQKAFWATSFEDFHNTYTVNSTAAWYTIVAFLALLDKGNKEGNVSWTSQVIATTSIAAFNKGTPGGYAYGQSKAAATHMMKQLAVGLIPHDIRSNIIAPGLYPSELAAPLLGREWTKSQIPLQRTGTEEDMAGLILYLCSRAGAYVTGTVMLSDGGRLQNQPSIY